MKASHSKATDKDTTIITRFDKSRRILLRTWGVALVCCLSQGLWAETSRQSTTGLANFSANSFYASSRAPVFRTPFVALPLGSVKARGWMLTQLQLQRDGLTGHAEELSEWLPALQNSAWMGGSGENWEKGPYYLKGLNALAYVLDDNDLKKKSQKWIEAILRSQRPDGFFGPENNADWWPRMVVTYALRDYYEATSDSRVPEFLTKYYGYMSQNLPAQPLVKWAKARGADEIDTILWLYNRTGDDSLITLAQMVRKQTFDWPKIFLNNRFFTDQMLNHNVNVSQAVKSQAAWFLLDGHPASAAPFADTNRHLLKEHGLVLGMGSGSEELAGRSPSQAVETCATVEQMLSDETNLRVLGDPQWGDNLERVTFNALPAALSKDIKQHVYYTRPNHPAALFRPAGYFEDGPDRFTPGPRSGFPCCCYNLHMGWPKYVQNSWAATHDNGLAVLAYNPSEVTAKVANGINVKILEETDYPFDEIIRFRITTPIPVKFPLELRIPKWCSTPEISIAGKALDNIRPGQFYRIERQWANGDQVMVHFRMEVCATVGYLNTVALERGPLIYSLKIEAKKNILKSGSAGFDQFELRPESPWNYALAIDPKNPAASVQFTQAKMPNNPFLAETVPVHLTAKARRLPEWGFTRNGCAADEPPISPVTSNAPEQEVQLIPFGAQFLRITNFPVLGDSRQKGVTSFSDDFSGQIFAEKWGAYGPGWYQDGGILRCRANKQSNAIALGTEFRNLQYDASISVPPKGDAGLLFRISKIGFGNMEFNGYYVGLSAKDQAVFVGKSNGSWAELKRVNCALNANAFYPIRISAIGSNISVYFQNMDSPIMQVTDADFAVGCIGVRQATERYAMPSFKTISAVTANADR